MNPSCLDSERLLALDSSIAPGDPLAELVATVSVADLRASESLAEKAAKSKPNIRQDVDGVAIVNIAGSLRSDPGFRRVLEVYFGLPISATYGEMRAAVREARGDASIHSTVLRISSPGGSVFGVGELADEVYGMRKGGYRIKAYAQDMAASAAYWIGAQAGEVVANEVAHVGSIGVFSVLVDSSKAAEAAGYRVVPVRSTAGKAGIVDGAPIEDAAVEHLRELIEDVAGVFVGAVARGRGLAREDAEKLHNGRVYVGQKARAAGLVDRIASFDEFVMGEIRAVRQLRSEKARARMAG